MKQVKVSKMYVYVRRTTVKIIQRWQPMETERKSGAAGRMRKGVTVTGPAVTGCHCVISSLAYS
jgi:hypothetical protein